MFSVRFKLKGKDTFHPFSGSGRGRAADEKGGGGGGTNGNGMFSPSLAEH